MVAKYFLLQELWDCIQYLKVYCAWLFFFFHSGGLSHYQQNVCRRVSSGACDIVSNRSSKKINNSIMLFDYLWIKKPPQKAPKKQNKHNSIPYN